MEKCSPKVPLYLPGWALTHTFLNSSRKWLCVTVSICKQPLMCREHPTSSFLTNRYKSKVCQWMGDPASGIIPMGLPINLCLKSKAPKPVVPGPRVFTDSHHDTYYSSLHGPPNLGACLSAGSAELCQGCLFLCSGSCFHRCATVMPSEGCISPGHCHWALPTSHLSFQYRRPSPSFQSKEPHPGTQGTHGIPSQTSYFGCANLFLWLFG